VEEGGGGDGEERCNVQKWSSHTHDNLYLPSAVEGFLKKPLVDERIVLTGWGAVDVFDEQDFVADLVIEELVDGASGEEETEAAGW
jgi:hypothetical protein